MVAVSKDSYVGIAGEAANQTRELQHSQLDPDTHGVLFYVHGKRIYVLWGKA